MEVAAVSPDQIGEKPVSIHADFIRRASQSISREKARISPTDHAHTLRTITDSLHLNGVVHNPEAALANFGMTVSEAATDRRKADVVTTLAAIDLVQTSNHPDNIRAAALLLTTDYPAQSEIRAVMTDARQQRDQNGQRVDLQVMGEVVGAALVRGVEAKRVPRMMASAAVAIAETTGAPPALILEAVRIVANNQPALTPELQQLALDIQQTMAIAQTIINSQSRLGLDPEDISFRKIGRIAYQSLRQANAFQDRAQATEYLKHRVDADTIPPRIQSLTDIIAVVDKNPEILGVSFDLYDTLVQWTEDFWDRFNRYPQRALKHFAQYGINLTEQQLREQINNPVWGEMWNKHQRHGIEVPLTDTISEIINRASPHSSLTSEQRQELQQRLTREYYELELENAVVMPGAKETMQALRDRGIKICLTSNAAWSREHIERVLRKFDLYDYFSLDEEANDGKRKAISLSSEPKRMKRPRVLKSGEVIPHHFEFFHHSWGKLKLPPEKILHVGDNAEDDVRGAMDAGAKSTHYDNPLAFNRVEKSMLREHNPEAYAHTVVDMQRQALERSMEEWLNDRFSQKIPEAERARLLSLAKEMYANARDVFAPVYLNLSEQLLQQLNNRETDVVLCLARDGLPISLSMKMLRFLDKDRYANIKPDQIKYIQASRSLLKKVQNPQTPQDQELRTQYLAYLKQQGVFGHGKVMLTDVVSGEGTNHKLMSDLLTPSSVNGVYLDVLFSPSEQKRSFLQEALGRTDSVLNLDSLLFHMESVFNGPFNSVKEFATIEKTYGALVKPLPPKKIDIYRQPEHQHAFSRGLSPESVLFLNEVAIRGILDATRIRHRSHLARLPDPSNREVAEKLVEFMRTHPIDDLRLSIPWHDKVPGSGADALYLPSENEFEDPRIPKKNLLLRK